MIFDMKNTVSCELIIGKIEKQLRNNYNRINLIIRGKMNKVFLMPLIIVLSLSIEAMQQPVQVYNQQSTDNLKMLMIKHNVHTLPQEEVKTLILAGADPDITTGEGKGNFGESTLLAMFFLVSDFSKREDEKFVTFLLDQEANPNKWNFQSPLHDACRKGYILMVRKLIEKKAQVNAKTIMGMSPLLRAVEGDFAGIVQVLLENGAKADIDFLDAHGNTPMSVARKEKLERVLELFEQYQQKS